MIVIISIAGALWEVILAPVQLIDSIARSKIFYFLVNILFYFLIYSFFHSGLYQAPVANAPVIVFLILYWIDLTALYSYAFHYYIGTRFLWAILFLLNILFFIVSIPFGMWLILLFMTPLIYSIYQLAFNTDGHHELLCFLGTGYPRNLKIEDSVWKPLTNKFFKKQKVFTRGCYIKYNER